MIKKALLNSKRVKMGPPKQGRFKGIIQTSKHPFMIPVFVFIGLVIVFIALYLLIFNLSIKTKIPLVVIINHDNVTQVVPSTEPTVGKLLKKLDIKLRTGDVVQPALAAKINQDDFRINIYRAKPIEIVGSAPGVNVYTFSASQTPRAIVQQAGIKLYSADYVSLKPTNNFLSDGAIGERVVINRATPVHFNLYGTPLIIRTHAQTVAQLIAEEKIKLKSNDQVVPALSTTLNSSSEVFIIQKGVKITSVTQSIPMPINTIYDNSLAYGTSAIEQQGSAARAG